MEMTDLKSAIEDYTDTAENGILGLKDRMDALETKYARPESIGGAGGANSDALEHKHAFLSGFIARGYDLVQVRLQNAGVVRQFNEAGSLYRGRLSYSATVFVTD